MAWPRRADTETQVSIPTTQQHQLHDHEPRPQRPPGDSRNYPPTFLPAKKTRRWRVRSRCPTPFTRHAAWRGVPPHPQPTRKLDNPACEKGHTPTPPPWGTSRNPPRGLRLAHPAHTSTKNWQTPTTSARSVGHHVSTETNRPPPDAKRTHPTPCGAGVSTTHTPEPNQQTETPSIEQDGAHVPAPHAAPPVL